STTTAVAGSDGSWSVPNPGLNNGDTVTAVATDPAGNASTPATAVVDAIAPIVTVIDQVTSDSTPVLTGTVDDPTAIVVVTVNGENYTATNNGNGTWIIEDNVLSVLSDNIYTVKVTATDSANNSNTSTGLLIIDSTAPSVIAITSISDDTGLSASDFITSDTSLTVNGT
ncbi:Ig-like domain-containing protein, partial [Acinetobacter seifertii]|uniref:Ig-like domain-containing protein n=1 Tax=Acinetobacter seifertii TaxID=1530123 RepID=UPI00280C4742